jgi:hypothetical protein
MPLATAAFFLPKSASGVEVNTSFPRTREPITHLHAHGIRKKLEVGDLSMGSRLCGNDVRACSRAPQSCWQN